MKDFKAVNLSKTYGVKTLFNNVSFHIKEGEHIGLIGQNGTGKSSLLSVLSGKDNSETGEIITAKDFRVGFLNQEPQLNEDDTIFEAVYNGDAPLLHIVKEYELALKRLNENPEDTLLQEAYLKKEVAMSESDAWQYDVIIKTVITQLGLHDLDLKIKELSGGLKKRVGLAQVLIDEPDLLILDEPTNHLDVESITWLEKYLTAYKGAVLLVTHDRYFLDRVVSTIYELDNGQLYVYDGNYGTYLEKKAIQDAHRERMLQKQARLYANELEWMRKGAKARTTKQKARIDRFNELEEVVKNKQATESLSLNMEGSRLGKKVFTFEDVNLSIDNKAIIQHFDYIIQTHDRIGIVGGNGVGKSTFLNAIAQEISFDSGIFEVGETVKIAYYRQMADDLPGDKRIVSYLREIAGEMMWTRGEAISITELLETFLFPRYMHGALISTLSGGEKRRLYLLRLLLNKPNVLLLDEPTNDLDIATLTVLENYLETFLGVVITVSHDRYFLDRICQKLIVLQGKGQYKTYLGSMSDYLEISTSMMKEDVSKKVPVEKVKKIEVGRPVKKKMTYQEQREWETIEDTIAEIEQSIENIQSEMSEYASDFEKLQQLQQSLEIAQGQLLEKMERWEYLADLAN